MVLQLKKSSNRTTFFNKFLIKNYYENEPRFSVYSTDNFPKSIKNSVYVINLDEYADVGTHWTALYVENNEVIFFDSFRVKDLLDIKTQKQTYLE